MRLIDVDELIEYYEMWEGEDVRIPVDILLLNLKKCPTAYDVKSVVEQLEEASYWTDPTYDEDGYSYDDEIEVIDLSDAIEIVKGGAV